jgi:hypothetical protein
MMQSFFAVSLPTAEKCGQKTDGCDVNFGSWAVEGDFGNVVAWHSYLHVEDDSSNTTCDHKQ